MFLASFNVRINSQKMTYSLTLVLKSSLKDTDRKKLIDSLKDLLGKVKITEKEWGQKPLSYPIKREVSGYYLNWNVDSENVIATDFEKKLLNNENVLRHLLLRK